jgi:hypothetical protein
MQDMINVLITHVHFLPDLLAMQQLLREICSWCRAVPCHRLEAILHRFFLGSLEHFLTVMHKTGTIITGSCALKMLLGHLYDSSSSDLNLIVPHGMFSSMGIFLREEAGYVNVGELTSHSSVAPSVSRFVCYRKWHLSVFLSQAGTMGLMKVIACSNTTAQWWRCTSQSGISTWATKSSIHFELISSKLKS